MKKLLLLFIIAIGVVFVLIYSFRPNMDSKLNKKSEKGTLTSFFESQDAKVSMNTEKSSYALGVDEIDLEIINSGNKEIGFGEYYTIEKNIEATWYEVPFKNNTAFRDILHVLESQKSDKEKINLNLLKYSFTKGRYRIIREFYSDGNKIELAAEFNIN